MPNETRHTLRYRILRYTPNLVRDEWVNIGVLLERADESRAPRRLMRVIEESPEIARVLIKAVNLTPYNYVKHGMNLTSLEAIFDPDFGREKIER